MYLSLRPGSRFPAVYRSGVKVRSGGIVVYVAEGHDERKPEVGIVAGRKVGNAVARNRAKRRLREAARRVPLRANTTYVVVATPAVLDASFDDVVAWLDAAVAQDARRGTP